MARRPGRDCRGAPVGPPQPLISRVMPLVIRSVSLINRVMPLIYMMMYGHIWQYIVIYGHMWIYYIDILPYHNIQMAVYGHMSIEVFGVLGNDA